MIVTVSHAYFLFCIGSAIRDSKRWKKLQVRLEMISFELEKAYVWDDPVHAGRISREQEQAIQIRLCNQSLIFFDPEFVKGYPNFVVVRTKQKIICWCSKSKQKVVTYLK
ncbi:hypothetical protein L6452_20760 [Arctium lappa]|uniref:Uncharacterized protein n=1 Tax=Arctium lappa TaxID=4217 RepID=A0ACB9BCB3_ARCLA|nr:hypothetical protein L6452_20760 [Arctium lappa]